MSTINKHIVMGRLGATPELKKAGSASVTKFSIATVHSYKDKKEDTWIDNTNWIFVECWGKPAEIICANWGKGDLVYVEGRVETDKFQDKDGVDRYATKTILEGDFKRMAKASEDPMKNK